MTKTREEQQQIIRAFIKSMGHDGSESEMIEMFGGDTSNEIVAEHTDGRLLYKSVDSSITVYFLFNPNDFSECITAETDSKKMYLTITGEGYAFQGDELKNEEFFCDENGLQEEEVQKIKALAPNETADLSDYSGKYSVTRLV